MKQIYLIKTTSVHHLTYAIMSEKDLSSVDLKEEIEGKINLLGPSELKQDWDGEKIISVTGPYSNDQFIEVHDKLFPNIEMNNDDKLLIIDYEKLTEANIMSDEGGVL